MLVSLGQEIVFVSSKISLFMIYGVWTGSGFFPILLLLFSFIPVVSTGTFRCLDW
jgi:hypothetical protein